MQMSPAGPPDRDGGYATAEAAVVLPSLLVVLAMAVWVLVCVGGQLRCVDAARTAARLASRGDPPAASVHAGQVLAPAGAVVRVRTGRTTVSVDVTAWLRPFGPLARVLPSVRVTSHAVAEREDVEREGADTRPGPP